MNIKPLRDYILLEEEKVESKGLELPENADLDRTKTAKVVEVGDDCKVKKNSKVLFKGYGFDDINLDGVRYLIGKEDGVIAIIK